MIGFQYVKKEGGIGKKSVGKSLKPAFGCMWGCTMDKTEIFSQTISSNGFHIKWIIDTHCSWKIKILGAMLELRAKQHCRFCQFGPILR